MLRLDQLDQSPRYVAISDTLCMALDRTYSCEKRIARKLGEEASISAGLLWQRAQYLLFGVVWGPYRRWRRLNRGILFHALGATGVTASLLMPVPSGRAEQRYLRVRKTLVDPVRQPSIPAESARQQCLDKGLDLEDYSSILVYGQFSEFWLNGYSLLPYTFHLYSAALNHTAA